MFGKLASLFVDIEAKTQAFDAGIDQSKKKFDGFASGINLSMVAIGGAFAAIGYGAYKAVMASSDLGESLSKTDAVFGDASNTVKEFANKLATDFGIVKKEALDAESRFAGLAKGIGNLSGKGLTDFTNQFTQLAVDMESLQNIPFEEAMTALSSGLSGETEPLKRFGIVVSEVNVKNKAYAMGIAKVGQELTEQQKLEARAALIMQKSADMQGDKARTLGGFANQSKKLWGSLQNSMAEAGSIMMPLASRILGVFSSIAGALSAFITANAPALIGFAESAGQAFDGFIDTFKRFGSEVTIVLGIVGEELNKAGSTVSFFQGIWDGFVGFIQSSIATIGVIMRNFSTFWEMAGLVVQERTANILEAVEWFVGAAGQYLEWFGNNWVQLLTDAFNASITIVKNFASNVFENLKALWDWIAGGFQGDLALSWTPLLDGFKATVEQLPDIAAPVFTSLQEEIDALGNKMAEAETKRANEMAKAAKPAAAAGAGPKAEATDATAAAAKKEEAGKFIALDTFARDLQSSILGKGNDAKRGADAAEKMVTEQVKTRKAIEKMSPTAVAG